MARLHAEEALRPAALAFALVLAGCASPVAPDPVESAGDAATSDAIAPPAMEDLALVSVDASTSVDLALSCVPADCNTGYESCFLGACVCNGGFVREQNPQPGSPTRGRCAVDPSVHTQTDVCTMYTASAVVPSGFFSKSATACDPGTMSPAGLASALARANYYRWLIGLPDFTTDSAQNLSAQRCALVTASNPIDASTVHNPPPSATCYTSDGATSAGLSSVAWSPGDLVTAIDLWIADTANAANLGNRREMMRRTLNPIGLGVYLGGTLGSGACMQHKVFLGTSPGADFLAYPPPGFSPIAVANGVWSFSWPGLSTHTPIAATVVRQGDGMAMPVTVALLTAQAGWEDTVGFTRSGWNPVAGQTYRVTVTAGTLKWSYDIKPVTCP